MNIEFKNIVFNYDSLLPGAKPVLNNINFRITDNEFIGIIGPTGSGKTTLVQLFTGLLKPIGGQVLIDGIDLFNKKCDIDLIRKRIGVVFQFPESQLFEETVFDDIAFALKNHNFTDHAIEYRIKTVCDLVGLNFEDTKFQSPFHLSEGEKRRVALAGILSMNPEVLILDEPTACLDANGISNTVQLLTTLHQSMKTIIVVSHNLDFVSKLCNRIIILDQGRIVFDGLSGQLFGIENILKTSNLLPPRLFRLIKHLNESGFMTEKDITSLEDLKLFLGG